MKSSPSIRLLIAGTAFSASTVALMKNDMNPSLSPFFFVKASCDFARNACTSVMSHSLKVVRMAAVCWAMTSWAAIFRRNGDIFFRVNRSVPGAPAGFSSARLSTAFGAGASAAACRLCAALSASAFVTRPPFPLPRISCGSSFSSVTTRRAAGESASEDTAEEAGCPADFSADGADLVSLFGAVDFASLAVSSIVATTSPIFTSAPCATMVCKTPSRSAVISVETLSVSRVKSGSPAFTSSPDFLCQTETIPLSIDSPTAGIFTSMLMKTLHYAESIAVVT